MTDFNGKELKVGDFVACASVHGFYAYDVYRARIIEFSERSAVVEFEDGSGTRSMGENGVFPKLALPLSNQKSKGKIYKKDAVGQDVIPGSKIAFARSREDRDSKGFMIGGTVTRTTGSFVFAKASEESPEVRKTLDKTVIIGQCH
jgi:hypothetical protein